jgi:hypothetical protein
MTDDGAAHPGTADEPGTAGVEHLGYRLLTGPDDHTFCQRVSDALADGYVLYGSPAITADNGRIVVAQAVTLHDPAP